MRFYKLREYKKALADAKSSLQEKNVRAFELTGLRMKIDSEQKLSLFKDAIKDLDELLKDLSTKTNMSKGTRQWLFTRAGDLEKFKRYSQAMKDIQLVRSQFPQSTDAIVFAARLYLEMEKYPQALGELNKLVAIDESIGDWHKQKAIVLRKIGRISEADAEMKSSTELEIR